MRNRMRREHGREPPPPRDWLERRTGIDKFGPESHRAQVTGGTECMQNRTRNSMCVANLRTHCEPIANRPMTAPSWPPEEFKEYSTEIQKYEGARWAPANGEWADPVPDRPRFVYCRSLHLRSAFTRCCLKRAEGRSESPSPDSVVSGTRAYWSAARRGKYND